MRQAPTTLTFMLLLATPVAIAGPAHVPHITVTRGQPAADDVNTEQHTGFARSVTREELLAHPGSVADSLKRVAGVQVRQRSGAGSPSELRLRGSSSQQVNVYLDGLLLNSPAGGGVDVSEFLTGQLGGIDVFPDYTPVQFGFPNLGGAVNLKTLQSDQSTRHVSVGAGSFGYRSVGAGLNGQHDAHRGLVMTEYASADNDFPVINDNQTPFNGNDDRHERRENADYRQGNLLLKHDHTGDINAQWMALLTDQYQALPTVNNAPDTRSSLESQHVYWQGRFYRGFDAGRAWSLRGWIAEGDEVFDDRQGRIGLGNNWTETDLQQWGLNPSHAWILGDHTLTASLEQKWETLAQENRLRNALSPDWERMSTHLGLQDDWQPQSGPWMISPMVAVFRLQDEGNLATGTATAPFSDSATYSIARLGSRRFLSDEWTAKFNVARNVRAPNLAELLGDRGFFIGNPDLQAERAHAIDTGIEYDAATRRGSLVIFHRRVEDAIVTTYDARGVGRNENISSARITGLEGFAETRLGYRLSAGWRFTLQDPVDTSDTADRADTPLPGLYLQTHTLYLSLERDVVRHTLEWLTEEGGYYAPGEVAPMPDKTLVNYLAMVCIESHTLILEANNLLDERYQDYNRFPAPGRNINARYTWHF